MAQVWLNGSLRLREAATVSIDDLGFLYGAACFETMRAFSASGTVPTAPTAPADPAPGPGVVFRLDRHLARLAGGLAALGIEAPSTATLTHAIAATLTANELSDARIRLTVSAGRGLGRPDLTQVGPPTVLVVAEPPPPVPPPARLIVSTQRADPHRPLASAKTANYLASLLALAEARAAGADDALLLGGAGDAVEAATANLFAIVDGVLLTPPLAAGPLPGVTREAVIECAMGLGMRVEQRPLPREVIARADELFLTSSVVGIRPVAAIEGWWTASDRRGVPGAHTASLTTAYAALVARETLMPR